AFAKLRENFVGNGRFGQTGDGGPLLVFQQVAADFDAALGAFEPDAVFGAADDLQFRVIGELADDVELTGTVVPVVDGRIAVFIRDGHFADFGIDTGGAAVIHAESPLGDVDVVRAPVGHFFAGVFVPPTEFIMAAAGRIALVGGLLVGALHVIDE